MTGQSPFSPKAFQSATIRAVLRSFDEPGGARRFLVADEAGLGKTVVARGVIQELVKRRKGRPVVVFYVCSSQSIAAQNVSQLLAFLDEDQRRKAVTAADRPGLLPLHPTPKHRELHLYTITPGTLASRPKRDLGRGKVEERALIYALFELQAGKRIPWLYEALCWSTGSFDDHVPGTIAYLRAALSGGDRRIGAILRRFHAELRAAFQVPDNGGILHKLRELEEKPRLLTVICRNALAAASLSGMAPNLVVFDEFQKFRDLMRESSRTDDDSPLARLYTRILRIVTGSAGEARLLLLSATPYEALGMHAKAKAGEEHQDFYTVLDFLHQHLPDAEKRSARVRAEFEAIETQMRHGLPMSEPAVRARARLTALLRQVMCRTERDRYAQSSVQRKGLAVVEADLSPVDVKSFSTFARTLMKEDQYWAVPLWTSVPLPNQTLGAKYVCSKRAELPRSRPDALTTANIASWNRPAEWPNVKARALFKALPHRPLAMPWVRPSRPWWPLAGGWAGQPGEQQADGKILVFSRFAAVPGAVAALASFDLECELHRRKAEVRGGSYGAWSKHKYAKPHLSPEVFQLFFVSTFLVGLDPLADGVPATRQVARGVITRQLREALRGRVHVDKAARRRPLPLHLLLIALSQRSGLWQEERAAWCAALARADQEGTKRTAEAALVAWEERTPASLSSILPQELDMLAGLALESPAIVMARALRRHWPDALSGAAGRRTAPPRQAVQSLVAHSFRQYIDRPWFAAALGESKRDDYASVLRRAVADGNFESVLDEHFWLLSKTSSESWMARIGTLAASLELNGGRTTLHKPTSHGRGARIRCHVALPLHQAKTPEADAKPGRKDANDRDEGVNQAPRPDQVRKAFNSPFWPNVLVTTSIGQEGLDFHPWCRSIAHWDPAPGPVELEQREGRVDRYAGLSIRRALAAHPRCQPADCGGGSVWSAIGQRAELLKNANEMAPWWQVEGARTVQFYLMTPGSREAEVLSKLERRRALYRMLLGVSDPEHLLAQLEAQQKVTADEAVRATLRLGAWELEQSDVQPRKGRS